MLKGWPAALQAGESDKGVSFQLLPCQQLSTELDIQQDVLETLLSYLEVWPCMLVLLNASGPYSA